MNLRERLLDQLRECRWQAMRELADEAEERGDEVMALGWRWLANNKKWPYVQIDEDAEDDVWIGIYAWYDQDGIPDENSLPKEYLPTKSGGWIQHEDVVNLLEITARYIGKKLKKKLPGKDPSARYSDTSHASTRLTE